MFSDEAITKLSLISLFTKLPNTTMKNNVSHGWKNYVTSIEYKVTRFQDKHVEFIQIRLLFLGEIVQMHVYNCLPSIVVMFSKTNGLSQLIDENKSELFTHKVNNMWAAEMCIYYIVVCVNDYKHFISKENTILTVLLCLSWELLSTASKTPKRHGREAILFSLYLVCIGLVSIF